MLWEWDRPFPHGSPSPYHYLSPDGVGMLRTPYLVLLDEPDGGGLISPAVLTPHHQLFLFHPVLQL